MSKYIKLFLGSVIILNILFAAWYLIHGDIFFNSDIARDFLLLEDLLHKKLVLIGPRASGLNGFFHGPLWMYLNFPIFFLTKGNPLAQGWFWYSILLAFLTSSFLIAKKLFNSETALIFVALLSSIFTIPYTDWGIYNGFYNPHGAFFLAPIFFYSLIQYHRTRKALFLASLLFINGCIIQFQVAFGGPLLIMTLLIVLRQIVQTKKYNHFFCLLVLLIPASSYILFDLRHNFSHMRAILMPVSDPSRVYLDLREMMMTRIDAIFNSGLHIFRAQFGTLNIFFSYAVAFSLYFIFAQKKDHKNKDIYALIAYLYVGYFLLSLIQNGWVQYFYWMPLVPLVYLFFARLPNLIPQKIAYILVFFALTLNLYISYERMKRVNEYIGVSQNSWKFQSLMVKDIFEDVKQNNISDFGFFVKAPDIFGYSSKYPFVYWQKRYPNIHANIYEKKQDTYIVYEPALKDLSWMNGGTQGWLKDKLHIATSGAIIKTYPNGFRIEKFKLEGNDLTSELAPGVNDWIYFR